MKDMTETTDPSMGSIVDRRGIYYTTILSHTVSTDGKRMICGLKSAKLALFDIQMIVKQNVDFDNKSLDGHDLEALEPLRRPQNIVDTSSPVYSVAALADKSEFVVGGKGEVQGWHTTDDNKLVKEWTIGLSSADCMVNAMATTDQMIFTGCGDNNVYGFDAETHKQTVRLNGHKDYVNCLQVASDGQTLYSGAEDGYVMVWDLRRGQKSVAQITPYQTADLSRPKYGKWIGALTLSSNNWLICGGGPHLGLWHLGSMSYATKFDTESAANVVVAHNDYIISGGNAAKLEIWELNGELKSTIPTSAADIFSINAHHYDSNELGIKELISGAGMSYRVDICTNWKYKDFELLVY
ncbi:unnamed protein product [Medioppia subpectinata]|uniref:THO complex subunit 6 n=1 Tax=Medioppia subpectinata TaxID=1979941 RepID=A0A7R9L132_9ACAR|nr:unnamed protein product [Medioppia subpectinata]CAG2113363.1 unnamed protein product [Medioppia subpectinata]